MNCYYKLVDNQPVPVVDIYDWAQWFEQADRVVARTDIGDATVSTVFLGVDHNFGLSGTPILWKTLVFGGDLDGEMERYGTLADARAGYEQMCARLKGL